MIFISLWIQKINQNVSGPLIKWLRIIGMFALYLYRLVFLLKKNSEDDQIGLFLLHVRISYGQSFLHIVSLIFSKCLCYKLHSYQYWAFWIGIRISAAVITISNNLPLPIIVSFSHISYVTSALVEVLLPWTLLNSSKNIFIYIYFMITRIAFRHFSFSICYVQYWIMLLRRLHV